MAIFIKEPKELLSCLWAWHELNMIGDVSVFLHEYVYAVEHYGDQENLSSSMMFSQITL